MASRQGFGELKTEQLGGHSQEQQRHRQAPIDDDRLTIICAQNGFFGSFGGEDVKILSSDLQKALPFVNTRLLMYRVTKSLQQPEL